MPEFDNSFNITIPAGWIKPKFTLGDHVKSQWSHYETHSTVLGLYYFDGQDGSLKKQGWHYTLKNIRCIDLLTNDDCFLTAKLEEMHESEIESISGSLIRPLA